MTRTCLARPMKVFISTVGIFCGYSATITRVAAALCIDGALISRVMGVE